MERTSSLVIKTVPSVQLAENEMHDECLCLCKANCNQGKCFRVLERECTTVESQNANVAKDA
jgi:hypothetical protein